jgi:precorrin-3B synthase
LVLADLLGKKFVQGGVHLTGCERSCAAAHVAPFTLLAVTTGRYHLYRRAETIGAATVGETAFGKTIARDIDIQQAAALIAQQS